MTVFICLINNFKTRNENPESISIFLIIQQNSVLRTVTDAKSECRNKKRNLRIIALNFEDPIRWW